MLVPHILLSLMLLYLIPLLCPMNHHNKHLLKNQIYVLLVLLEIYMYEINNCRSNKVKNYNQYLSLI
jgi:hypothetical protein